MASLFMPPKSEKPKIVNSSQEAEKAKARINAQRRRSAGGFSDTIVGSGLKTATGQ